MKILMTSDTYLPLRGGGEYHVYYLMRELTRLGHQVTLVTTGEGTTEVEASFKVRRLPYRGVRSIPRIVAVLWRESAGVDLLHSHYSYRLACLAATVALLRRKPFVLTQHGLGLLPQAGGGTCQNLVFRFWRWWSMLVAHRIVSTSEDLSIEIRALGFGGKIIAIPNGYDPERFHPLPPPVGSPIILAVRRLVPKTGVQYLIAALPFLRERHPDLRCEIVGQGRLENELLRLADTLGVTDTVTFAGSVSHAQLVAFYRRAHVVVLPSTAESTSLTCIEAMACGKVIVASRVGGLIELLGSNEERGYLVPLTDTEHSNYDAPWELPHDRITALANKISYALTHSEEAQRKAREAASYAATYFTWPQIARRTIDRVYLPLLPRAC